MKLAIHKTSKRKRGLNLTRIRKALIYIESQLTIVYPTIDQVVR